MSARRNPRSQAARADRRAARAGARQSTLRETNLSLVARTVYAAPTPPSRAWVATATGMTRSTVSRLVDDLVAGGLVAEMAPAAVVGPGRPATPLVPTRGAVCAVGLQVDPTFLSVRIVDLAGEVLASRHVTGDHLDADPEPVLRALGDLAREALAELPSSTPVVGAGLAVPGIVDDEEGRVLRAPNLGWSDVDAVPLLGELAAPALGSSSAARIGLPTSLPVTLGNEAALAALTIARERPGHPGELTDFAYLAGGVGVGGAVVVDGRLVRGQHGWAGEFGHVSVDPDGPACRCGSFGCLEQYAGGAALVRAAGLNGLDDTLDGGGDLRAPDAPDAPSVTSVTSVASAERAAVEGADAREGASAAEAGEDASAAEAAEAGEAAAPGQAAAAAEGVEASLGHPGQTAHLSVTAALVRRAQEGDAAAGAALDRAIRALSVALADVVNVLDIPTIVLGGHLAALAEGVGEELSGRLAHRVISARWAAPQIVPVTSDVAAGALGAALRELDAVIDDPAAWIG